MSIARRVNESSSDRPASTSWQRLASVDALVLRAAIALCLVITLVAGWSGPAEAGSNPRTGQLAVTLRVLDELGAPLKPSVVMACPYELGTSCNDEHLVAAATNEVGLATLRLKANERYDVTAFVVDPDPAWACPGYLFNGGEYYFATTGSLVETTPSAIRARHTLEIDRPAPTDCAPVRVVDQDGNALPSAALGICELDPDGTPCPGGRTFDGPDPDGVIRIAVDPAVTYRLGAGVQNSGWPCPGYTSPEGDTFHFSNETDITGADLAANGLTLVIERPAEDDCGPVYVQDQYGNALPTAGLFVCPLEADGTPCPGGNGFDGPDADGIIRVTVDPAITYRLGAYLIDSGWPCPSYVSPDGTTFHFSGDTDILGADLVADGLTLVIRHPAAEECPADNATVDVVDDLGNALPAGLFVCPLEPDGTPCPGGTTFDGPDHDGVIRLHVDPDVTYRLGAFLPNSGWPCVQYTAEDGTTFHFSGDTDILGADLIANGLTLVIHHPTDEECPEDNATVHVVDDLGNEVLTAGLFVCPLTAEGVPCPEGTAFDVADAAGAIRLHVDPAVTYRLGAFIPNSGWPCVQFTAGDGTTFHFSPSTDILGADLIANGLTLVIHHPTADECP